MGTTSSPPGLMRGGEGGVWRGGMRKGGSGEGEGEISHAFACMYFIEE